MTKQKNQKSAQRGNPKVIAAILDMVYYSCIRKKEVIDITINDVVNVPNNSNKLVTGYTVIRELSVFKKDFKNKRYTYYLKLNPECRLALEHYLDYLLNNTRYKLNLTAPLFQFQRNKYKPKTLENHILYYTNKYLPNTIKPINFNRIYQSGLINYYFNERKHLSKTTALSLTAIFARHSKQHTEYLLTK